MKGAVEGLAGALGAALLGVAGLIARRLLWGKAEDEATAVKAAHQAVEAVDDALGALRREIAEVRADNKEKAERILRLEARVRELEAA